MPRKALNRTQLIHKLDRIFSIYVRRSHADEGGTVQCVTCDKLMHWKDSEAGHFVKRGHHATRYDRRNVYPQCSRCNHFLDGAQDAYALFIVKTDGQAVLEELLSLKRSQKVWRAHELRELIDYYQAELKQFPDLIH